MWVYPHTYENPIRLDHINSSEVLHKFIGSISRFLLCVCLRARVSESVFLFLLVCSLFEEANKWMCVCFHTGSCLKLKTGLSQFGKRKMTQEGQLMSVVKTIRLIFFTKELLPFSKKVPGFESENNWYCLLDLCVTPVTREIDHLSRENLSLRSWG